MVQLIELLDRKNGVMQPLGYTPEGVITLSTQVV